MDCSCHFSGGFTKFGRFDLNFVALMMGPSNDNLILVLGKLCYYCLWEEPINNGKNLTKGEPPLEIPEIAGDGRQIPLDSSCKTSKPSTTVYCRRSCVWSVYTEGGIKTYLRGCDFKNRLNGCRPFPQLPSRTLCDCSTYLCNNRIDATPVPNYGCRMSENKTAISFGILAVLFKSNIQTAKI